MVGIQAGGGKEEDDSGHIAAADSHRRHVQCSESGVVDMFELGRQKEKNNNIISHVTKGVYHHIICGRRVASCRVVRSRSISLTYFDTASATSLAQWSHMLNASTTAYSACLF